MCQRAIVARIATGPVLGPKILEYPMQNLLILPTWITGAVLEALNVPLNGTEQQFLFLLNHEV